MGCACATRNYRDDIHLCAKPMQAECICKGGVIFYDEVMGVLTNIVSVVFPFTYLNLKNGEVSTVR
jgi:hypothetical protein